MPPGVRRLDVSSLQTYPAPTKKPCYNGSKVFSIDISISLKAELLEFYRTAGFFDFGLDLFGIFFGNAFLQGSWAAFDHLLGFHQ
ncbi:hypothetical protein Q31b_08520 [Novipirellula aureliae]|uniref:Uncharacterized protein n=1 Tax=Novipirellula aureliae TaxID=2527966 RepID=A0A5C6EDL6_9BACT|nr:hypothetical protein Q31b_08520 [Novipirellula aureliae]